MIYSWSKAVTIIADATKPATAARGDMMRAMIKKGWAPTSLHTLRRLLNDRAHGKLILDIPWTGKGHNGGGRHPVLESEDISKLVDKWKRGESHGRDMITKAINQVTDSTIRRSGGVPFHQSRTVSKTTVTNIRARIANHPGL